MRCSTMCSASVLSQYSFSFRKVGPFIGVYASAPEAKQTAGKYQDLLFQFISLLEPGERGADSSRTGHQRTQQGQLWPMLEEFFGEKIISQGLWPPRSPDLTPPDFFFVGTLKGEVYATNPGTIEQLRNNITASIAKVTPETLNRVFENKVKRIHACLRNNGGHFQQDL